MNLEFDDTYDAFRAQVREFLAETLDLVPQGR